ncbi:hypothetical protein SDC9_163948 [bioreactor metagenome]|uniref:Uncharacterized protein n=1 Tax=bioreactor metagenome TaxID=1076179 RepID=A0A645FXG9_9ZZZZ
MGQPPGIGRERGLKMPVGPHQRTECGELSIVANGQNDVAVAAFKHLVRRQIGVHVADALRVLSRCQVVRALVGVHGYRHVQQCDVQVLPAPGTPALHQCRQHRAGGIHACHQIDHGHARAQRARALFAIGHAGVAHQAAHALEDVVIARLVRIWSALPKARD